MLNKKKKKGGHRPTRLSGATEKIVRDGRLLSTFYGKDDEAHDSPT
ncbi:hypothetical protein [uncultured Desulfuromonas sp.]|nr:hypothetical protein [uncultured Desulfuromonas sp.]